MAATRRKANPRGTGRGSRRRSGGDGGSGLAAGALLIGGAVILAAGAGSGGGGGGTGSFRPEAPGVPVLGIFPLGTATTDSRLNLDPVVYQYGILTATWPVRNTGGATGQVGGHIIIQERGLSGENAVVEGDWVKDAGTQLPVPRLRTNNLSVAIVQGDPSRSVLWNPPPLALAPNSNATLAFSMQVGAKLLEGKTELDIVLIVRRLDTLAEVKQVRVPNALQAIRSEGFVPVGQGAPVVEINTF